MSPNEPKKTNLAPPYLFRGVIHLRFNKFLLQVKKDEQVKASPITEQLMQFSDYERGSYSTLSSVVSYKNGELHYTNLGNKVVAKAWSRPRSIDFKDYLLNVYRRVVLKLGMDTYGKDIFLKIFDEENYIEHYTCKRKDPKTGETRTPPSQCCLLVYPYENDEKCLEALKKKYKCDEFRSKYLKAYYAFYIHLTCLKRQMKDYNSKSPIYFFQPALGTSMGLLYSSIDYKRKYEKKIDDYKVFLKGLSLDLESFNEAKDCIPIDDPMVLKAFDRYEIRAGYIPPDYPLKLISVSPFKVKNANYGIPSYDYIYIRDLDIVAIEEIQAYAVAEKTAYTDIFIAGWFVTNENIQLETLLKSHKGENSDPRTYLENGMLRSSIGAPISDNPIESPACLFNPDSEELFKSDGKVNILWCGSIYSADSFDPTYEVQLIYTDSPLTSTFMYHDYEKKEFFNVILTHKKYTIYPIHSPIPQLIMALNFFGVYQKKHPIAGDNPDNLSLITKLMKTPLHSIYCLNLFADFPDAVMAESKSLGIFEGTSPCIYIGGRTSFEGKGLISFPSSKLKAVRKYKSYIRLNHILDSSKAESFYLFLNDFELSLTQDLKPTLMFKSKIENIDKFVKNFLLTTYKKTFG